MKTVKYWLQKAATATLVTTLFLTNILTTNAFTLIERKVTFPIVQAPVVEVTNSYTSSVSNTINTENNEIMTISYCIDVPAYVKTGIYKATSATTSDTVAILESNEYKLADCYSVTWDGKYGDQNEIGTKGKEVPEGQYFYGIHLDGINGLSEGDDYISSWIYVENTPVTPEEDDIEILDVEVKNRTFDPYDDEEARITFTTNRSAYITLEIYDEDDEKVVEVVDEKWYQQGESAIKWDGKDKYDDEVDQGEYEFKLTAEVDDEKDTYRGDLRVKKDSNGSDETDAPRIKDVYMTKESFDPNRNEKTYLVYTLTAEADVKVTLYRDGEEEEELYDEDSDNAGTYALEWDADDYDDDYDKFELKIEAENDEGDDEETIDVETEEDEKSNNKPNIYKDKAEPHPYKPRNNDLEIYFKTDRDAEVTVQIRDGDDVLREIIDEKDLNDGSHTVKWDGKDDNGDYVDDGVYQYKIIAQNNKGKDVEKGNFSVQDSSNGKRNYDNCSVFSDVDEGYKYCEAITWAYENDVFDGYYDGTFKPNQPINRAEALKVVLEAMDVKILSSHGEYFGFSDTDAYAWYMPYLKTGLTLGIVNGYSDATFRPANYVNRIEALKMVVNTGKVKYGNNVPNNYYGQPYLDTPNNDSTRWYMPFAWYAQDYDLTNNEHYLYPGQNMTRGEMADMLYRYSTNVD